MNEETLGKLLDSMGVHKRTRLQGNFSIPCPLAPWRHASGMDNNPSMTVSFSDNDVSLVKCWACGFAGTFVQMTQMLNHLSDGAHDKVVELAEKSEKNDPVSQIERYQATLFPEIPDLLDTPKDDGKKKKKKKKKKPKHLPHDPELDVRDESELDYFKRNGVPEYAKTRGFDDVTCAEWEFCHDPRRQRMIVPVRREDKKLVGIMGRSIPDDLLPKWWAYWNFPKGDFLYGEDKVKPGNYVVVCEGMFDVIRLHSYGFENTVCIFGTQMTNEQARRLQRWTMPVVLFFDGDHGGEVAIERAGKLLENRVHLTVVETPKGQDPDSITKEQAWEVFEDRKLFSLYF